MARKIETRHILTAEDKTKPALKSVQKNFENTKKRVDELSTSTKLLGKAMGPLAAFGSAAGLIAIGKSAIESADKMAKLSKRLGASTTALSQYKYAADSAGVSFETLTMGWQRMTRRVAEAAQGTGEAKGALQELGISASALNQLAPDKQFERLADAIAKVENPADRVRLAMKLFDSEGVSLIQMMQNGSAGMLAMRDAADKAGATLSDEMAKKAETATQKMSDLKAQVSGLVNSIMFEGGLIEGITTLTTALTSLVGTLSQELPIGNGTKLWQFLINPASLLAPPDQNAPENWYTKWLKSIGIATYTAEEYAQKLADKYGEVGKAAKAIPLDVPIPFAQKQGTGPFIGTTNQATDNSGMELLPQSMAGGNSFFSKVGEFIQAGNTLRDEYWKLMDESNMKLNEGMADAMAIVADVEEQERLAAEAAENLYGVNNVLANSFINLATGAIDVVADSMGQLFELWVQGERPIIEFGKMMRRMAAQVISALVAMIAKMLIATALMMILFPSSGAKFGQVMGNFKSAFSGGLTDMMGGRATGGPVGAGKSYMVGEKGPELFTPSQSGFITPNNQVTNNYSTSPTVNVYAQGDIVNDPLKLRRLAEKINDEIGNINKTYYNPSTT